MASDEIVWQIINQQFCSYKLKAPAHNHQTFCRNPHNVTGLCNRQSCPLANSRYATIRADPATGALYLYMKTIERAHLPSQLWERQKLSKDYSKALAHVDKELAYWPKFLVHKCKQRLTRLTQVNLRMRRLAKEEARLGEKLVPRLAPKVRKREEGRERKAERAAKVERAIERELVERLRSGAYGDRPLNVEEGIWRKVMRAMEREGEAERDVDLDEGIEEEEEDGELEREIEAEGDGEVEYVSDIDGSSDEEDVGEIEDWLGGESPDEDDGSEDDDESDSGSGDSSEDEDAEATRKALESLKRKRPAPKQPPPAAKKRGSKGPRTNIEYEIEHELPARVVA